MFGKGNKRGKGGKKAAAIGRAPNSRGGRSYVTNRDQTSPLTTTTEAAAVAASTAGTVTTTTTTNTIPASPPRPPPPCSPTTTNTSTASQRSQRKAAVDCLEKLSNLTDATRYADESTGAGTIIAARDVFKDSEVVTFDSSVAVRWAIAHIYSVVLGSPPEFDSDKKEQWGGQSGTYSVIRKLMPGWVEEEERAISLAVQNGSEKGESTRTHRSNKHKQIKRVVECIDLCKSIGVKFDGEVKWAGGRDTTIKTGSPESHIVADALEAGNSLTMTVSLLNDYLCAKGKEEVGYTPVYTCCQKMKPQVIKFAKRQQGNKNPESGWAISRRYIMRQILLREKIISVDDKDYFGDDYLDENGNIPEYFDIEKLRMVDTCRLAYFDESHCKCII